MENEYLSRNDKSGDGDLDPALEAAAEQDCLRSVFDFLWGEGDLLDAILEVESLLRNEKSGD